MKPGAAAADPGPDGAGPRAGPAVGHGPARAPAAAARPRLLVSTVPGGQLSQVDLPVTRTRKPRPQSRVHTVATGGGSHGAQPGHWHWQGHRDGAVTVQVPPGPQYCGGTGTVLSAARHRAAEAASLPSKPLAQPDLPSQPRAHWPPQPECRGRSCPVPP